MKNIATYASFPLLQLRFHTSPTAKQCMAARILVTLLSQTIVTQGAAPHVCHASPRTSTLSQRKTEMPSKRTHGNMPRVGVIRDFPCSHCATRVDADLRTHILTPTQGGY